MTYDEYYGYVSPEQLLHSALDEIGDLTYAEFELEHGGRIRRAIENIRENPTVQRIARGVQNVNNAVNNALMNIRPIARLDEFLNQQVIDRIAPAVVRFIQSEIEAELRAANINISDAVIDQRIAQKSSQIEAQVRQRLVTDLNGRLGPAVVRTIAAGLMGMAVVRIVRVVNGLLRSAIRRSFSRVNRTAQVTQIPAAVVTAGRRR